MEFYLNDLYPNQGFYNTRNQTIPEADDKKALAEDNQATVKAKTNPKSKSNILIGLVILLAIVVALGVLK